MYESPRDSAPQLRKFLVVLTAHRAELEQRMADLDATLAEVRAQERDARRLLESTTPRATPRAAPRGTRKTAQA